MTRALHIHVEEPSMAEFLNILLPRMLNAEISWKVIDYGSKPQLLRNVPCRLRGYKNMPVDVRPKALILVDRDNDDCRVLKSQIEVACDSVGLFTKSRQAPDGSYDVVSRIVIEELEAWFFGDVPAMISVWPGVPASLNARAAYRDPDGIVGGTHEALFRVLQRAGHLSGTTRMPKIESARRMARALVPEQNRSSSFRHFRTGLSELATQL